MNTENLKDGVSLPVTGVKEDRPFTYQTELEDRRIKFLSDFNVPLPVLDLLFLDKDSKELFLYKNVTVLDCYPVNNPENKSSHTIILKYEKDQH